jgi:hypothetical protein
MATRTRTTVIVADEGEVPASVFDTAGRDELRAARRLLSWQKVGDVVAVKRKPHRVGAARVGDHIFNAPPTIPVRTFLALVFTAYGLRPDQVPAAGLERDTPPELFRAAMGASLVSAADVITRQHIHQAYEPCVDRLQLIRGRPRWTEEMGRPRDGSVTCEYQLKTTDTLLNRLVLAGLIEARRLQPSGPLRRRAERQAFTWRGLADPPPVVRRHELRAARSSLTRQTTHYESALVLAEALLFGTRTPGDEPADIIDLPVYDLAVLFERLVENLSSAVASLHGYSARLQHTRSDALIDAEQNVYRRVRPDIVIFDGVAPVAVLDAKYKPRYTTGGPDPAIGHRVTVADAYQLFFYAERLRRLHQTKHPIPAFVVAPLLDHPDQLPRLPRRTVIWEPELGGTRVGLRVLPVPLVDVLDIVLKGGSFATACEAAPELADAIRSVASPISA